MKKLNILITNQSLDSIGGTETYIYALVNELKKRGHNVVCFSFKLGVVAKKLPCKVLDNLQGIKDDFDVIHAHHHNPTIYAHKYIKAPIIFIKHGLVPKAEEIPSVPIKKLFVTSNAIKDWVLSKRYYPQPEILYNGVDVFRFRPLPLKEEYELLVLDNYGTKLNLNYKSIKYVGGSKQEWNVEETINRASVVLTTGRGALEAMACNKPTIVYGRYGCDGLVTSDNYFELRKNNFSGRRYGNKNLRVEIEKAKKEKPKMREFIIKYHNITDMVSRLEKAYYKVL